MFGAGMCTSKARLDGKTAVVTGSNVGIGKMTAKEFYKRGARVIVACRDLGKAEKAVKEIKETVQPENNQSVGELVIKKLDLSSLKSVKQCAKDILQSESHINILVNNAGVYFSWSNNKTEDGFETQFGVNHLGHFLFTCLLLPRILNSTPARIVIVSSVGHKWGSMNFDDLNRENSYIIGSAYCQSKLANILFSNELAERLKNNGVNVYSLHPGVVKTELMRNGNESGIPGLNFLIYYILFPFFKTPEEGAQTSIYCAISEDVAEETGCYYSDCKKDTKSRDAQNPEYAKRLWTESVKLVGLNDWDPFTAPSDRLPPMLENI